MSVLSVVWGLLVRGLQTAEAAPGAPTLFVDGGLAKATLPAGYGPLSDASLQIVGRKAPGAPSGASSTFDLRDPLVATGAPSVDLIEDQAGSLAKLFAADPGFAATDLWLVLDGSEIARTDTGLILKGPVAPAVDQIVYLAGPHGAEAVRVTAVGGNARSGFSATVTRGACGSYARAHSLLPSAYPPGDNGIQARILASSRPIFEEQRFDASLYCFKMSDADPSAVSSVLWAWNGFVAERPTANAAGTRWTIRVAHVSKLIAEHRRALEAGIELAHCAGVVDRKTVGTKDNKRTIPTAVDLRLERYELERLFGWAVHLHQGVDVINDSAGALEARLLPDNRTRWQVASEIGGYPWVFNVTGVKSVSGKIAILRGALVTKALLPDASLDDAPVTFDAGGGFATRRNSGLNEGWIGAGSTGETRVRRSQGERGPKVTAYLREYETPAEAMLRILVSGIGDGTADAAYDTLPPTHGLQIDPAWVDYGAIPADPQAVNEGTISFTDQAALLPKRYAYGFAPEGSTGEWFRNELSLNTLALGFDPVTGKLGIRQLVRRRSSVITLNPLAEVVEPGELLDALKIVYLERGIDPRTLEPLPPPKPLHLLEAQNKDVGASFRVRVWEDAAPVFTDVELQAGALERLQQLLLRGLWGRPRVLSIRVALDAGLKFGDQANWTDDGILTAAGRGVAARALLVLGIEPTADGTMRLRCLEDGVNLLAASQATEGKIAPALYVYAAYQISGTQWRLWVRSVSGDSFRIDTSHGGIWASIDANTSRVRVVHPREQNPDAANERPGWGEVSGTVVTTTYYAASKRSELVIAVQTQWDRAGLTRADVLRPGAWVALQPFTPADLNPEGVVLAGDDAQGAAGYDAIQFSSPDRQPRHDGHRSLVGA